MRDPLVGPLAVATFALVAAILAIVWAPVIARGF